MKLRMIRIVVALCGIASLAAPVQISAQQSEQQEEKKEHTRYKVIEIGTFGGPNFFANVAGAQNQLLNNRGTLVGGTENSIVDSYCFNPPECVGEHAFRWKDGVLTDLGTLPGGANSQAFWINARGVIVGLSQNVEIDPFLVSPVFHAVVWKNGKIIDLGTLGGYLSLAQAINNRGQVVGVALNGIADPVSIFGGLVGGSRGPGLYLGTQTRAFLWEDGVMRDLGTLGGPDSWARYVNECGQVAGVSFTDSVVNPATGVPTTHSFLWEDDKMTDLGSLGGTLSDVEGLNNRGEVVGEMSLAGDSIVHAFLWDQGTLTDLGTLGGTFGLALGVNEEGEIVGTASTQNDQAQFAFLWKKGVLTNLGAAPGDDCSVAQAINSRGQVVGPSFSCAVPFSNASDATLWEHGSAVNLNTFVPPGSDFHLTGIDSYINDLGEIAVTGALPNGDRRAFVLIPCEEGEEGCVDGDEAATTAAPHSSAPVISRSATTTVPQRPLSPHEKMTAWRAQILRRYHMPGLTAPKN